jgi:hypothetical protein
MPFFSCNKSAQKLPQIVNPAVELTFLVILEEKNCQVPWSRISATVDEQKKTGPKPGFSFAAK